MVLSDGLLQQNNDKQAVNVRVMTGPLGSRCLRVIRMQALLYRELPCALMVV
jgi:hypothetical protein